MLVRAEQKIQSVRLTIRVGQVCELGAFSTPNQASSFSCCRESHVRVLPLRECARHLSP